MKQEEVQFLEQLLDATKAPPPKFYFIRHIGNYIGVNKVIKEYKRLISEVSTIEKVALKTYIKLISSGHYDGRDLVIIKSLGDIINYYKNAMNTMYNMVYEYKCFLKCSGKCIKSLLLGYIRGTEDDDLQDYSGLGFIEDEETTKQVEEAMF